MLIPIGTYRTCDFLGGSGPSDASPDPTVDPRLYFYIIYRLKFCNLIYALDLDIFQTSVS